MASYHQDYLLDMADMQAVLPTGAAAPLPKALMKHLKKDNKEKVEKWLSQYAKTEEGKTDVIDMCQVLYNAVDSGALECTQWLLDSGVNPDGFKDGRERTALLTAVRTKQADVVKLLLDCGADLHHADPRRVNSVILSARHGHLDCLKVLIERGGRLNDRSDFYSHSALTECATSGHVECLKALLEAGADVNIEKSDRETSLMVAAENGYLECVKALLAHGADVHRVSSIQQTALFYAAYGGHHAICSLLLEYDYDFEKKDNKGYTVLAAAISSGDAVTVEKLFDKGANISDVTDILSVTRRCAGNGGDLCLDFLLKTFPQVQNIVSDILFDAVSGDHIKCVELLVKHGANIHVSNRQTLLHEAAQNGSNKCMEYLLNQNICVNAKSNEGYTALFEAAQRGEHECIATLISNGADLNVRNSKGQIATMVAFSLEVFEALFNGGIDIHAQDEKGMNTLMFVCDECIMDNIKLIKILLDMGAGIDVQDYKGQTAIMYAAKNGAVKCLKLLIERGANVNLQDYRGGSVMDHCLLLSTEYNPILYTASKKNLKALLNFLTPSVETEFMIEQALCFLLLNKNRDGSKKTKGFVEIFFKFKDKFTCIFSWCCLKLYAIAEIGDKGTIRYLLMNGVKPAIGTGPILPLIDSAVLKYFIANELLGRLCILKNNIAFKRTMLARHAAIESSEPIPAAASEGLAIDPTFGALMSQPWPLVKICLHSVSDIFSGFHDKKSRLEKSGLPPKIQRFLTLENDCLKLCPRQWDHIPIVTEPAVYDQLPRPRPMLDHWPIGHDLQRCGCKQCGPEGLRFQGVKMTKDSNGANEFDEWAYFLEELELFSLDSDDEAERKERDRDILDLEFDELLERGRVDTDIVETDSEAGGSAIDRIKRAARADNDDESDDNNNDDSDNNDDVVLSSSSSSDNGVNIESSDDNEDVESSGSVSEDVTVSHLNSDYQQQINECHQQ